MRVLKIVLAIVLFQLTFSCSSKKQAEPSLAGKWNITSAVGNDDRHWTGSFTLTKDGSNYNGLFLWDAVDGQSTGTDKVTGTYDADKKILTLRSEVITGNIESVTYTMNVTDNGTKMNGVWTGSSDGTVENPGHWTAEKE